jgi:tRNA(Arg) A34 adenosine deaminase TadA
MSPTAAAAASPPPTTADAADHERFMRRAIALSAKAGIEEKTGKCFGAVVVKDGAIIAEGYNHIWSENDPTSHGEIDAIRKAAKKLGTPSLAGCVIYSSTMPWFVDRGC